MPPTIPRAAFVVGLIFLHASCALDFGKFNFGDASAQDSPSDAGENATTGDATSDRFVGAAFDASEADARGHSDAAEDSADGSAPAQIDSREGGSTDAAESCDNGCPASGSTRCEEGTVSTCAADAQGCRAWKSSASCATGRCDADGKACAECDDPCSPAGLVECSAGAARQCKLDGAGCLRWMAASSCDDGDTCTTNDRCDGAVCSGTPNMSDANGDGTPDCRDSCPNDACDGPARTCSDGKLSECVTDSHGCNMSVSTSCESGVCWDGTRCALVMTAAPFTDDAKILSSSAKIAIGPDGTVWLASTTTGYDLFLSKWSNDGALLWKHEWGTSEVDSFATVGFLQDGRLILTGLTRGALLTPTLDGYDPFLMVYPAQIDASTPPAWSKQFTDPSVDAFEGVAVRADGRIVVAASRVTAAGGGVVMALEPSDGSVVWQREITSPAPLQLQSIGADGNDVFVLGLGSYTTTNNNMRQPFLAHLDAQGNNVWQASLPIGATPVTAWAYQLVVQGGRIYAPYVVKATDQSKLAVLDKSHTLLFEQTLDPNDWHSFAVTPDGQILWKAMAEVQRLAVDANGVRKITTFPGTISTLAYSTTPSELIVTVSNGDVNKPVTFVRPAP